MARSPPKLQLFTQLFSVFTRRSLVAGLGLGLFLTLICSLLSQNDSHLSHSHFTPRRRLPDHVPDEKAAAEPNKAEAKPKYGSYFSPDIPRIIQPGEIKASTMKGSLSLNLVDIKLWGMDPGKMRVHNAVRHTLTKHRYLYIKKKGIACPECLFYKAKRCTHQHLKDNVMLVLCSGFTVIDWGNYSATGGYGGRDMGYPAKKNVPFRYLKDSIILSAETIIGVKKKKSDYNNWWCTLTNGSKTLAFTWGRYEKKCADQQAKSKKHTKMSFDEIDAYTLARYLNDHVKRWSDVELNTTRLQGNCYFDEALEVGENYTPGHMDSGPKKRLHNLRKIQLKPFWCTKTTCTDTTTYSRARLCKGCTTQLVDRVAQASSLEVAREEWANRFQAITTAKNMELEQLGRDWEKNKIDAAIKALEDNLKQANADLFEGWEARAEYIYESMDMDKGRAVIRYHNKASGQVLDEKPATLPPPPPPGLLAVNSTTATCVD